MKNILYRELASRLEAIANCAKSGNVEWGERHREHVEALVSEHMPSGSGFDSGTKLDMEASHGEKLVFFTSYHHMDGESGMYDGWSDYTIVVTPSLAFGFKLRIVGRDRNETKDYVAEVFSDALRTEVGE